MQKKVFAAIFLICLFMSAASAFAGTPDPSSVKQAAKLTHDINASILPQNAKDALLKRVQAGLAADKAQSQFSMLDHVDGDFGNAVLAVKGVDEFIKLVNASPDATPKVKQLYLAEAAKNRSSQPEQYMGTMKETSREQDNFSNLVPLIVEYKKFLKTVAASRVPDAVKKVITMMVNDNIDSLGDGAIAAYSGWLDDDKTRLIDAVGLTDYVEETKKIINNQCPGRYPDFKKRNLAEVEALKTYSGNGTAEVDRFRKRFNKEVALMQMAAEIQRKILIFTNITSFGENRAFQLRLDPLVKDLVAGTGADEARVQALSRDVDMRQ